MVQEPSKNKHPEILDNDRTIDSDNNDNTEPAARLNMDTIINSR